jgi:hypothetical protein
LNEDRAPRVGPLTPDEISDVGRTELAWSRSGLANVACGVVIAKGLPVTTGVPAQPAIGLAVALLGLASMVVGGVAARHRLRRPAGTPASERDLAPLALCSCLIGVAVLGLVAIAA